MKYEIYLTHTFLKCIKPLKKKFPKIKDDLDNVFIDIERGDRNTFKAPQPRIMNVILPTLSL